MSVLLQKLQQIQDRAKAKAAHYEQLLAAQEKLSQFHQENYQVAKSTQHLINLIEKLLVERDETLLKNGPVEGMKQIKAADDQLEMEFL